MNVNIGHGNQRVTEAVVKQMQEVSYVTPGCVTKVRGELGKKLAEICPGDLNKSFFTLCGATSIENAIKLARLYTVIHIMVIGNKHLNAHAISAMASKEVHSELPVIAQQQRNIITIELHI